MNHIATATDAKLSAIPAYAAPLRKRGSNVECAAELMAQGNAIQLKNGPDVALRLYGDIHIKGGNINLQRARELMPGLTDITPENAQELVSRAGLTVRAYAEVEQKFTDLLLAQGASVTSSGRVVEKAPVARKDGSEGGDNASEGSTDQGGENGNGGNGGTTPDPNEGGENEE